MTAAAADRMTRTKAPARRSQSLKMAGSTKIWKGTMVALNSAGFAVPAATTAGLKDIWLAEETVDNTSGSNGDKEVWCTKGVVEMAVDATDPVTQAHVGQRVYVKDDQTVCASTAGSSVVAGRLQEIDEKTGGAWINQLDDVEAGEESSIETVTGGALSLDTLTSLISVTGTQAYTLAAGKYEGQRKQVRVIVAASTPDGTLTPATFADGASIDLDAVNETVELEWHDATGWRVINISGATITP